ncbi:MAG: hypothetical protein LC794_06420 [Acidobacteria bacterium]|nr:hypothetical protein [Acidobacteriota bacterium]
MVDATLEAEIRRIIYNDYGVGNQNIDSEEIYNKLIQRGIDVPRNAMGDIFSSLRKRGLIRGIGKMDSSKAPVHGFWSIMWVDRHIAV